MRPSKAGIVMEYLLRYGPLNSYDLATKLKMRGETVADILRNTMYQGRYGLECVGTEPRPPGKHGQPRKLWRIDPIKYAAYIKATAPARRQAPPPRKAKVVEKVITKPIVYTGPIRTIWLSSSPYCKGDTS